MVLSIFFEKDLVDFVFVGVHSNIKEKLEHFEFLFVNQLLQNISAIKSPNNSGESHD
jgi:hypothetical protein